MRLAFLLALLAVAAPSPVSAGEGLDPDGVVAELRRLRDAARREDPGELPVRFLQEITAWQPSPLRLVLGEREEGDPERYSMTHPVFAFEWADGRLLVADAGLALAEAEGFARPAKLVGADAIQCNPRAWSPLLRPGTRIAAVVFTHLHIDHTTGVRELCGDGPVPIRLSPEQERSDERHEETGREGLREASPGCVRFDDWRVGGPGPVEALAGFPGAYRVAVPGHTPGSQLVVGFVPDAGGVAQGIVVAGDVVNHRLGFQRDVDKPWWYRWFIVRENREQQAANRLLLRQLVAADFDVRVNHDLPGASDDPGPGPCSSDDESTAQTRPRQGRTP